MWVMIEGMIYGVPEMRVVMLGFGEVMFTPLRRYIVIFSVFFFGSKFLINFLE